MSRFSFVAIAFAVVGCVTCPNVDETIPILPPANGDAAVPADLPARTGDLDVTECQRRCDAGNVVSCSYEEPAGLPTMHCVLPSACE